VDEVAQQRKQREAAHKDEPESIVIPDYEHKHSHEHDEHHEELPTYSYSENYDESARYSNKILNFLRLKKYLASNVSLPSWFSAAEWKGMVEKSLLYQYFENSLHTIGSQSKHNDAKRILTKHYPLEELVTAVPIDDNKSAINDDQMLQLIKETDALALPTADNAPTIQLAGTNDMYSPIKSDQEARSLYQRLVGEQKVGPIISLSVDRNVFDLFSGGRFVEGGWFDGDLYPERLRTQWINHGVTVNIVGDTFEQRLNALRNFRIHQVVGKQVGHKLDEFALQSLALEVKWKKGKFGSIIAGACYGGLAVWALYYRWVHVNNKEYRRQKMKYAYRVLDEESPTDPIQHKIAEKHKVWAANYYAEEEEEETEEEAAEEDE